ncbi:SPOC domain-like protein [Ascobolus immersus RN42]|uniref:ATP-dependent DNA helicase II subunit 2 n=1 Tax=Ascobolus immersus RN42 TaxID=1160509 RepID=A0A3N4I209_ASCIM|nr:SPOC domain-like protein [Ascobolus immersus RN42]
MADKAATVYVVDLGASMGQFHSGRTESDLDFALRYVWDKITDTVMNGRKTDTVGVVGFRTDGTDNSLMQDPSYQNIKVLKPLGQCLLPDIRNLQKEFVPSGTDEGDGMSAIVVAIDLISSYCRHLKYIKKIIYVSNGTHNMDPAGFEDIIAQLNELKISLTVVGVDFDDEEYGFKEEDKSETKAANEQLFKTFCSSLTDGRGVYATCAEVIETLQIPRMKQVRPVKTFNGVLTLGDPEDLENSLIIDVEQFPKIMQAKPVSASSFAVATGDGVVKDEEGDAGMEQVRADRVYTVEEENGKKKEVEVEELDRGYMYGRAIVPINASDREITDFNASPGLEIVGFIPKAKYERYLCMSNCTQIVAKKDNPKARLALSSLIHAMYELDHYGLGRFVASTNTKSKKSPVMCILVPSISPDHECLIKTELPFAEDVRHFRFPPLDHVKTTSGKVLTQHRLLPTPELQSAMDDLVDSMDLMTAGTDDDGNPCEYAKVEDVFSPLYHRINQVIKYRAVHPDEPVPPPHDILVKYSQPPKELLEKEDFEKAHEAVLQAAEVKKVPPKQKGFGKVREQPKPLSGLDIDALLNAEDPDVQKQTKANTVSPTNAIPDFKRALENGDENTDITTLSRSFLGVIEEVVKESIGDSGYERAVEMMAVLRSELIDYDAVEIFNELLNGFKKRLTGGEFGGDRSDFWEVLRKKRLGLIKESEGEGVGVGEEEAKAFWEV